MKNRPTRTIAVSIITVMAIIAFAGVSQAAEVTLAWDPHENTHTNLTGYNLYYKAGASVQADPNGATLIYIALTDPDFDPDHPNYTVTDLQNDINYFFTITAMVDDDESGMSNEVSATNGVSAIDQANSGTPSGGSGGGGGCFITHINSILSRYWALESEDQRSNLSGN
jgi:uncharacterized membrane protein YgcG